MDRPAGTHRRAPPGGRSKPMSGAGYAFPHLYLSVPGEEELPAAHWADALLGERHLRPDMPGLSDPLQSLLVGGGRPEALGSDLPERVRQVTGPDALREIGEWTVELSDHRMSGSVIAAWLSGGVTRLSLRGAAAAPGSLARLAKLCGGRAAFGVDLPLASVSPAAVGDRIRELVGLGAGSLAFVEGVGIGDNGEAARDPERLREAWLVAAEEVGRAGWSFLDLAFAFGPAPCPIHPQAIARRNPVLGLGPGAVTFRHPRRRWNHMDSHSYVEAIRRGEDPLGGREALTRAEGRLERCWTALRSARGLRLPSPACASMPWFQRWQEANWLVCRESRGVAPDRLRLAPEGWLVADGLAVELAVEMDRIPSGGSTDHPEFQNFEE
ncbi:MAG: hypothetical protein EA350_06380 [Gemmatimonadales bacterium]|nr:MAG: hypothetical protein EA350_06380 [Gemmatimonadales bacterium]